MSNELHDDSVGAAARLKWIYVLDGDFSWQSTHRFGTGMAFEDSSGKRRLELHASGEIRVLKEYAWDGCSPKYAFLDVAWGIPDGIPHHCTKKPKAYEASLVHDALYQFLDAGLPLTRKQADMVFRDILVARGFLLSGVYYAAVRLFGELAHQATKRKRGYRGRSVTL